MYIVQDGIVLAFTPVKVVEGKRKLEVPEGFTKKEYDVYGIVFDMSLSNGLKKSETMNGNIPGLERPQITVWSAHRYEGSGRLKDHRSVQMKGTDYWKWSEFISLCRQIQIDASVLNQPAKPLPGKELQDVFFRLGASEGANGYAPRQFVRQWSISREKFDRDDAEKRARLMESLKEAETEAVTSTGIDTSEEETPRNPMVFDE